jgi:menaquinone-dependent protoporphyrinogen oxidase
VRVQAVAGALLYSTYNFIIRFVMKQIAKKASRPTDTSHDYEFTNWKAIDGLVDEVLSDTLTLYATQVGLAPA